MFADEHPLSGCKNTFMAVFDQNIFLIIVFLTNFVWIRIGLVPVYSNRLRIQQNTRARICRPFKEPRNRFPALRAGNDNPICRAGPPGYIGWRNRFLGAINVYKYGLWIQIRRQWRIRDTATVFRLPVLRPQENVPLQRMGNKTNLKTSYYKSCSAVGASQCCGT
jgi:hypothetical protein